jgi:uncharacterized protein (TIGR04255 family)
MGTERFANPPLVEAVFEIRFPGSLAVECRRDAFQRTVESEFPELHVPAIDSPEPYPLKAYEFRNPAGTRILKTSIRSFSYHVHDYVDFNEFRQGASRRVQLFCDTFGIGRITRTGTRYINRIPVVREGGVIPLSKYLRFVLHLPESVPHEKLQEISCTFRAQGEDGSLRVIIHHAPAKEPPFEALWLDLDYISERECRPSDLEGRLEFSHSQIEAAFLQLVADDYRRAMAEESA